MRIDQMHLGGVEPLFSFVGDSLRKRSGFDGYLCIEFGGKGDDHEGVLKSKALLERYI